MVQADVVDDSTAGHSWIAEADRSQSAAKGNRKAVRKRAEDRNQAPAPDQVPDRNRILETDRNQAAVRDQVLHRNRTLMAADRNPAAVRNRTLAAADRNQAVARSRTLAAADRN